MFSPFKVTRKISYFFSAISVPLWFKSIFSNHRGTEYTEYRAYRGIYLAKFLRTLEGVGSIF